MNSDCNSEQKLPEVQFFVEIGFEVDGEVKYVSSSALQAAFKDDDLKALSFYDVIKFLSA